MRHIRGVIGFIALASAACLLACTAGGGGLSGGGGQGGEGAGGSAGQGGVEELTVGSGGAGGGCQQLDIVFEPQTPSVVLLVDRSGSMFDNGSWDPLKKAALNVVAATQDKIRYGLLTFTGIAGQQCPLVTETPIDLDNLSAIQTAYDAASVKPGDKLETPTAQTLSEVAIPKLLADVEGGGKYIVFVTDGEPDRCDDGIPECARDDVVGAVQAAHAQGITTFVFGLGPQTYAQHLQDVANAGVGQPVMTPGDSAFYPCFGGDWSKAKGAYADAGGTAKYYTPDPTDASALEAELSAAIAGAKSCSFDLQGKIEVDLENASEGKVTIDGVEVPYDPQNGWSMASPTELVLSGQACEDLKKATAGISFDFPCEVLVPK
ncbi:MAG: VWA domain-containing protein [Polyangiaceae bacterium]